MEQTLVQTLLNELRCYTCLHLMEIPSIQCLNGHYFCEKCIKESNNCPECKTPIETRRNYLFEKILLNTILQCSFTVGGCTAIGSATVIAEHEDCCSFQPKSSSTKKYTTDKSVEPTMEMQHSDLGQNTGSKTESAGQSLEEILLTELECPVCMRRPSPPINQCQIGHIICEKCFERVNQCPLCRQPKSCSGNVVLERLFNMIEMPCNNAENGCVFREKGLLITEHEKSCEYVLRFCPLSVHVTCTWHGIRSKLIDHCSTIHSDVVSSGPKHEWDLREFLRDRHCQLSVKLVHAYGILFRICWNKFGNDVTFNVDFLESEQTLPTYTFALSVTPPECANAEEARATINEGIEYDEHSVIIPLEPMLKICEDGCSLFFELDIGMEIE